MYEYRCKILRVVDGDTVDIDLDLGFGIWLRNERVRISGIDTPESRTSDEVERIFGNLASNKVKFLLPVGSRQILYSKDFKGKFGRILGDFLVDGYDDFLTNILLENHLAVPYEGQSKEEIEQLHIENRKILLDEGVVTQQEYYAAVKLTENK